MHAASSLYHRWSVAEKATSSDAAYRYADGGQLCTYFEKSVLYHCNAQRKGVVLDLNAKKNMCEGYGAR